MTRSPSMCGTGWKGSPTRSRCSWPCLKTSSPDVASHSVRAVDAVLDSSLRSWSAGRLPIAHVDPCVSDAVTRLHPSDEAP
jgi:hypothetical protein